MRFREAKTLKSGDVVIFRTNKTKVIVESVEIDERYRDAFIHSADGKTYHHTSLDKP